MDAAYYTRINSAPGEFSATAVSSGRKLAVHGCAFDGNRLAGTERIVRATSERVERATVVALDPIVLLVVPN